MPRGPSVDWPALLPDVARRLLGEPPRTEAGGATWRYRSRGSLAVHVGGDRRGTWRDHEAGAGGGTLDLVQHVNGCDKAGALAWLVDARLIAPRGDADPARIRRNRRRGARIATRIAREAACERSAAAKWYLGTPSGARAPSWRRLRRN